VEEDDDDDTARRRGGVDNGWAAVAEVELAVVVARPLYAVTERVATTETRDHHHHHIPSAAAASTVVRARADTKIVVSSSGCKDPKSGSFTLYSKVLVVLRFIF
jgi:hypothetical protein